MSQEQIEQWENEYKPKFSAFFKDGTSEQLVSYLDEISLAKGYNVLELTDENINPGERELVYYEQLEKISVEDMREIY